MTKAHSHVESPATSDCQDTGLDVSNGLVASDDIFSQTPPNWSPKAAIATKATLSTSTGTIQNEIPALVGSVLLACSPTPAWKRVFDVCSCLLLIILLAPLLAVIALMILLVNGRPVFFAQKRLGLGGKYFVIYKFRTLQISKQATDEHREFVAQLSSTEAPTTKPDLSARLIAGGSFLRSTSLDELPQLFNILRGDMSLIGPRPDVLLWEDYQPWQLRRFDVLPGVTGLWQVSGKNLLTFNEMIEKDLQYVDNRSIRLDLQIMWKTVQMLLRRENY